MNIKEGIEKRFSVRAFTKEVPDMKLISEILKTANAAPSGGNIQPWKVYVLNEQVKNNLAKETLQNFDTGVQEEIEYDIYPKPLADVYKKEDMNVVRICTMLYQLKRMILILVLNKLEKTTIFLGLLLE